jgi:hypothetical protein
MRDRPVTEVSIARRPAGGSARQQPQPLYWRFLRLHHVRPNGWQRAILVEGVIAVAVTLVLADVASAWTLLVLPATSALLVKAHDVVAGMLQASRPREPLSPPEVGDYTPFVVVVGALLLLRLFVHGSAAGTLVALVYGVNAFCAWLVYRYAVRRGVSRVGGIRVAAIAFFVGWLFGLFYAMREIRLTREEGAT